MNRIGERVGPYQLESLLSEGGGVALYRAFRPEGSREPRVVEIRLVEPQGDERAAAQVRNEYEVLRHLNDGRIPRTHGFYAGFPALSIAHHKGVRLSEIIRLWRDNALQIDVPTAMDILMEIALALRGAHPVRRDGTPIVHGHLGSHVILVTPSGRVFVQGFGASPRGTFAAYTSPEQAAAAFIDARSDQWALGAIGVELLLGERLYTGTTDRREAALNGAVEKWVSMLEHRFPAASRVLGRMLSTAAGDRYVTNSELIADLLVLSRKATGPADIARLGTSAWTLMYDDPDPAATQPDASLAPSEPVEPDRSLEKPLPKAYQPSPEEAPTVARTSAIPLSGTASHVATVDISPPGGATVRVPSGTAPGPTPGPAPEPTPDPRPRLPSEPGPSLASPQSSTPSQGPSLVSLPTEEVLEPTELISPSLSKELESPAEAPTEEEKAPTQEEETPTEEEKTPIEEAMQELKTSEMAAFIMVGVLVLVTLIFLVIRYS